MARLSKDEWLHQSLLILAEVGAGGLTIDALTNRLGVTKGSFYHHFSSYQDFKISLLDAFEAAGTHDIIRITEEGRTPGDKLQRLLAASADYPPNLEPQIRAWALQDEDVRAYQERIDRQRVDYVEGLYLALTGDATQAKAAAQLIYTLYVGAQQIVPPVMGDQLNEMYFAVEAIFVRREENAGEKG